MKNNWSLTVENFHTVCSDLGLDIANNKTHNIWIGFSGGVDSRVLLELTRLAFSNNYKLIAIHINHGINNNADLWQEHCSNTCKTLNIEFRAIKIIIDPSKLVKKNNLEATLRLSRLEVWKNLVLANDNDVVLLAHHMNDQIETLFLRLLRGSGLKGLAAIKSQTNVNTIKIIRPLLNISKTQIEDFAKQHNLLYIQDDSNYDQKFTRNFLRHTVFPQLNNKWPKFINNINRTIKHLQQADLFITKIVQAALVQCYIHASYNDYANFKNYGKNILSISKLLTYDNFLQTEILRQFIINQGFYPPDESGLQKIYTEIIAAGVDRQPKLNLRQYIIRRYRDKLYIYAASCVAKKNPSFRNVIGDLAIYVGDSINKISIAKAKKIFQKFGIPPWQRYDYPLVFCHNKLIAILGLWCKGL